MKLYRNEKLVLRKWLKLSMVIQMIRCPGEWSCACCSELFPEIPDLESRCPCYIIDRSILLARIDLALKDELEE